jgi:hypothetical protein
MADTFGGRSAPGSAGTSGLPMSETHYRRQAEMCRSEALLRRADPSTSAQWLKIAAEYDKLAVGAAALAHGGPPPLGPAPAEHAARAPRPTARSAPTR